MSNQQHTAEPWRTTSATIRAVMTHKCHDHVSKIDTVIAYLYANDDRTANARRIVACVNACAGIDTELLELAAEFNAAGEDAVWEPPHPIFRMASDNDRLAKQLDELLAALEDVKIYLQDTQAQRHIYDRVIEAVASVKGGAACA